MLKKLITILITLMSLILSNLFISNYFKISFLEISFAIGLLFSIVIALFSSKGGFPIKLQDSTMSYLFNKTSEENNYNLKFYSNIPFLISVIYTIVFGVINIVIYWDYFFNI